MPIAKTVTGRLFEYSRLLGNGPDDFLHAPHKKIIPVEIIKVSAGRSPSAAPF
jgi:hypothetical protein